MWWARDDRSSQCILSAAVTAGLQSHRCSTLDSWVIASSARSCLLWDISVWHDTVLCVVWWSICTWPLDITTQGMMLLTVSDKLNVTGDFSIGTVSAHRMPNKQHWHLTYVKWRVWLSVMQVQYTAVVSVQLDSSRICMTWQQSYSYDLTAVVSVRLDSSRIRTTWQQSYSYDLTAVGVSVWLDSSCICMTW